MKRKKPEPKPRFPRVREEFAGELTPGIWPGPITGAHSGRFAGAGKKQEPEVEDTGIWTPED